MALMEATLKSESISVEEYLEGEKAAETRHEFVGGHVYAMAVEFTLPLSAVYQGVKV